MNSTLFAPRREKIRRLMHKTGLDALLVTLDANRFYLSGFELKDTQSNESAGCLVLTKDGRDWLCTDPRYLDAARRLWEDDRIFIYRGNAMEQINGLLEAFARGLIGFDSRTLSVDAFETVGKGLALQKADGMVEALRVVKESEEIACLEQACALNHKLMQWLPQQLQPGRSEAQIAWEIEQFFRNNGAEELSFPCIVAVGPNAALPHAEPGHDLITDGCGVLVDVGCRLNHYCSDQTRSFWVGDTPDTDFAADLAFVQEAQDAAISLIGPGVTAADVYYTAKKSLDARGVGHLFTHGLGHGVGLHVHEEPSLGSASPAVLIPGMVVTVEPGLYRPGKGGVRWEYMVLVTEDGSRVL